MSEWPADAAAKYLYDAGEHHYNDGLENDGLVLVGAATLGLGGTEEGFREILAEHCCWPEDLLDEAVAEVLALDADLRAAAEAGKPLPRMSGTVAWTRLRRDDGPPAPSRRR